MNIWYGMGALYVVIFIHTRYKICLILVVCCVWENIIRVQGKVLQVAFRHFLKACGILKNVAFRQIAFRQVAFR
ncbi:hypothetical protein U3516DRAFT_754498 [Neocallimastix sp. 'constans']